MFFLYNQKTAYEMRISDWSSDVCSSDLHGSEEQKQHYLPQIASGALRLQAFGVTEPTSGTDTLALRTTAVRDGDDYIVNGQKIWTSRAEHSDLMLLLARTTPRDQVEKKVDGLSIFLVDMRAACNAGMTIKPIRTIMNHSTTEVRSEEHTSELQSLMRISYAVFCLKKK